MTGIKDRHLVGVGAAAVAVCCAPPLFTLLGLGLVGAAATVATFLFAGAVFAMVVATATLAELWRRHARARRPSHHRHPGGHPREMRGDGGDDPFGPGPVDVPLTRHPRDRDV